MTDLTKEQKIALCSAIKTSRYAKKVVTLLREMAENLYEGDNQAFISEFSNSLDEDLLNVLRDIFKDLDMSKPMDIEDRLKLIIHYLKDIEEVGFTIPIHPKKEFLKRIYDWCSTNLQNEILLTFTTNRMMDSGLIMVYKGHFFEYSLENLLDEYFEKKDMSVYLSDETVSSIGYAGDMSEENDKEINNPKSFVNNNE